MDTRRDFIYIDDLVNVVMQAVVDGTGHGHYHVSTGSDYAIKELFDATDRRARHHAGRGRRGAPAR